MLLWAIYASREQNFSPSKITSFLSTGPTIQGAYAALALGSRKATPVERSFCTTVINALPEAAIQMRTFFLLLLTIDCLCTSGQTASFDTFEWRELKKQIGGDSIVGLGETGHGFETINESKSIVADFLRSELDFRAISFESSFTQSIISFLDNDSLDTRAKAFLYPFWNTGSVKRLLKPFHSNDYTQSLPLIVGFDIQEDCRYTRLSEFLKGRSLVVANLDKLTECDSILSFYIGKEYVRKRIMDNEAYTTLISDYDSIALEVRKHSLDPLHDKLLQRCIDNRKWLCKYLTLSSSNSKMYYRDSLMAVNIVWLKNELYNHTKIIVWAADTHIAKTINGNTPRWTGEWLSSVYPYNYYTISFQKGSAGKRSPLTGASFQHFESLNKKFDTIFYLDKLKKIDAYEWLTPCD